MARKTWIVAGLVLLLAFAGVLGAGAQQQKFGLIFTLWDFDTSLSDGLSAGAGLKYWLGEKMALRGLVALDHTSNSATDASQTDIGLSAALEYHFATGRISPYLGGLFGVALRFGDIRSEALMLAGLFGAEVRVMDGVGLYAEYNLQLIMDDPTFDFDLVAGNGAAIGVVVYLP